MHPGRSVEDQGSSLPQRPFASTLSRALATAAGLRRYRPLLPRRSLLARAFPLAALSAAALTLAALSLAILSLAVLSGTAAPAQQIPARQIPTRQSAPPQSTSGPAAALRFAEQRRAVALPPPASGRAPSAVSPALAMARARAQHLALLQSPQQARQQVRSHSTANFAAPWQPLGPSSVLSPTYNNVTGRVTAIAPDPNDPTGATVYLGTTGGGVWKSSNAAGPLSAVSFTPLTDTLPVFSPNAGTGVLPSLSIGALAVQPSVNPVVIAGTGDPNDATDSLYGEGLLLSSDGGLHWTLVQQSQDATNDNPSFFGLATAGIAFSTATPTLVVAAFTTSPESSVVNAPGIASVPGLFYSTDAGQTWKMATLYDGTTVVQQPQPIGTSAAGNAVTSVVWDGRRGMFYAAVRSHGYYGSPDGATWTRLSSQPGTGLTPSNCPVGANGAGSSTCPIFRGTLAVQPLTGDLYALTVDANDNDQGLWQDLCNAASSTCATPSPTFAKRIDGGALETGGSTIAQGGYNLALNAAPAAANGTDLFVGTIDLYRCSMAAGSSSCTLRNTTNTLDGCDAPAQVAPAQHALASVAQGGGVPLLYLGNDSGLWRSLDGVAETGSVCSAADASHFDNLNPAIAAGGSLAETVGFAQDPTTANTLIAGLGANGSAATSDAAALPPWPQLSTGEGGLPSIDPATPRNWYIAIGAGVNLAACSLGIDCNASDFVPPATIGAPQVDGDASLLDAPTLLDPSLTSALLLGTCRVWRGPAASGASWSGANALSPALGGDTTPCSQFSPLIRSIGAGGPSAAAPTPANSGSEVLYAGLSGSLDGGTVIPGHVFVTTSAATATATVPWTDVALSPVTNDSSHAEQFNPGAFDISSMTVDPHDPTGATVYATVMGFGVPHVYRSTSFGASWLNVSANLPDAPANALAIDPNDANTVYVALDTGVYATQAIATCGTTPPTGCWSVLGRSLPNAPSVALAAAASLPVGDGRIGMLRVGTYGRGVWQTPLLTAAPPSLGALTLSSSSLTFAAQPVGTQSAPQTLTLTNSGNSPLAFATPVIAGNFTETDNCSGQTLAAGGSCSLQVFFDPASTGTLSGELTLYANIAGGQATVALSGTGTSGSSIVLTPLSLTFPATVVNQTSPSRNLTVANTGSAVATLHTPTVVGETGDFSIYATTCAATLAPDTACSLTVVFTPTAGGPRSATLSLTDNVGTQTATLTGTGNAPATDTLSPPSLTFPQQAIGTASAPQILTLTNAGGVPLTLIAASVSPGDFSVVNACGNSLAANATCAFSLSFSPTAVGSRTATLTVTDQFRTQTVALSGTGIAGPGVSLTPVTLAFPPTGVGLTAVAQTLTLTNNGGVALHLSGVAVSRGFAIAANTCGTSLAVAAACTLTVVFAPTAPGIFAGTLTFTDNATGGTQTTSLTGMAIDFSLTATGATSITVPGSGGTATYPLQLTLPAGLTGNIALACTGAPANSICTVVPSLVQMSGTQTGGSQVSGTTPVSVTVDLGVAPSAAAPVPVASAAPATPPRPWGPRGLAGFALLLPLALLSAGRRRAARRVLPLALLAVLGALDGCGTGRAIPTPTSGGTPAPTADGTYTITVSATSAGLTHSVNLTLIVQH